MKKALTLALTLLLAMSVLFVPGAVARAQRMIDDFEPGGTNLPSGYWGNGFTFVVDNSTAKSGSHSLKLTNSGGAYPELHSAAPTNNLDGSGMTHIEVWVKTSVTSSKAPFKLRLIITDGNGKKWFNEAQLDKEETENDFVLASYQLTDFMDYATSSEYYDPEVDSTEIDNLIFVTIGLPSEGWNMWLDDLMFSNPTAPDPADPPADPIPDPPTPDTSGYLTYIQNFDSVSSVEESKFRSENPDLGQVLSLDNTPGNFYDGTQSLKVSQNAGPGYGGVNVILNNEVDISGYDYLEAWIKTSETETKGNFEVRTRLNLGGTWFAATTIVYKAHTEAGFVQIRVPLTSLNNGIANFDPESDETKIWMYQIDWSKVLEAYDVWIDGIALVSMTAPGEEEVFYTVSFNSMGGSPVEDQRVREGEKAVKPDDPVRNGYKFVEWQIADGDNYVAFDFNTPITSDIVLRAKWVAEGSDDGGNGSPDTGDMLPVVLVGLALSLTGMYALVKRKLYNY